MISLITLCIVWYHFLDNVTYRFVLLQKCFKKKSHCVMSHSSVIRKNGESQNGCFKTRKHTKFSEKQTFVTPWSAHVRVSGGKKCSFFGNFGVLSFRETPVLRFALFPYYRRIIPNICRKISFSFRFITCLLPIGTFFWVIT